MLRAAGRWVNPSARAASGRGRIEPAVDLPVLEEASVADRVATRERIALP
jgi:hypothetical protein